MRAVNLLPAPQAEQRQDDGRPRGLTTKTVAIAAGLLLVLVTAALGVAFVHERSVVNNRQSTLNGLQAKVAQTHAAAASSAAVASATQAQIAAITSAANGRIAWDSLLGQLSRVMPSGASLVSLQASDGNVTSTAPSTSSTPSTSTTTSSAPASALASSTHGSASTPTSFVVTGYAVSQATVATVLDRLALMPALTDVSLQSAQRSGAVATNTNAAPSTAAVPPNAVQFTIGASLRSAGGTSQ